MKLMSRFRVSIHTAEGWKEYGRYETMRGAQRAAKNATRKFDCVPLRDRVGGYDSTYLVIDDVPADGSPGYFDLWGGTNHQGCYLPWYHGRTDAFAREAAQRAGAL
jgi:hypothetical protein